MVRLADKKNYPQLRPFFFFFLCFFSAFSLIPGFNWLNSPSHILKVSRCFKIANSNPPPSLSLLFPSSSALPLPPTALFFTSPHCPSTEPLIYDANNSCDDFISDWRLIFSLTNRPHTHTHTHNTHRNIGANRVRGNAGGRGKEGGSDREMKRKESINGIDRVMKGRITELTVWGEDDFLP